jgi:cystathionine beta-lyase/cystathionine gamma-synthase
MSEGFSTRAIHAGQPADPATGAVITPIYQTSTYVQEEIGRHKGYEYSRTGNPTRAALEGGEFGLAYSSGLAATDAVLATLRPGDHIIVAEDLYGGTYRMFENIYRPRGLDFTYVDGRRVDAFADALRPETRLIWIETPTNPLLHLVDIAAVAVIATQHGALLAVDNTFATPYLQRPLALGAHVVVYSVTKYLGGHSDVVGGALITGDRTLYDACRYYQNAAGAVPGLPCGVSRRWRCVWIGTTRTPCAWPGFSVGTRRYRSYTTPGWTIIPSMIWHPGRWPVTAGWSRLISQGDERRPTRSSRT